MNESTSFDQVNHKVLKDLLCEQTNFYSYQKVSDKLKLFDQSYEKQNQWTNISHSLLSYKFKPSYQDFGLKYSEIEKYNQKISQRALVLKPINTKTSRSQQNTKKQLIQYTTIQQIRNKKPLINVNLIRKNISQKSKSFDSVMNILFNQQTKQQFFNHDINERKCTLRRKSCVFKEDKCKKLEYFNYLIQIESERKLKSVSNVSRNQNKPDQIKQINSNQKRSRIDKGVLDIVRINKFKLPQSQNELLIETSQQIVQNNSKESFKMILLKKYNKIEEYLKTTKYSSEQEQSVKLSKKKERKMKVKKQKKPNKYLNEIDEIEKQIINLYQLSRK